MTLALPGVFSGIDTSSLIEATLQAEATPLNALTERKTGYEHKQEALNDLEQRISQLYGVIQSLDDANDLRKVSASSSDKAVATVSVGSGAMEGSHTIEVNRLATAERRVHDGVDSAETLVGAGTFTYEFDGIQRTIVTTDTTTLEEFKDMINNDADNPGVTASLLEYTSEPGKNLHLVLNGNSSGADYTISVVSSTLAGFDEAAFTTTQAASNSQVRIDGYPSGAWIERSSNSLSDLVPGVTINLQGVGTTTIGLSRSTSNVTQTLTNLVEVYNGLVDAVDAYTGYDQETGKGGILQGDATINGWLAQIRSRLVGAVPGFADGQDTFSLTSQLGIEVDRDGVMSLDNSTLSDALQQDYDAVLKLIGAVSTGAAWNSNGIQFLGASDDTTADQYNVKVEFDGGGTIVNAWIKLASEDETAWREAGVSGNTVTGASGQPEEDLRLSVSWDGASQFQTADVRVQQGFAGRLSGLLDDMLDATEGAVQVKREQYDDAVSQIDKQIERQKDRLEKKEKYLREKYARLEATLADLDSLRASYDAMFQSLGSMKSGGGSGSK